MADQEPRPRKVVTAYGDGGFRIAGERHEGSIILFPERVLAWPVAAMADLTAKSLVDVTSAAADVDLLLLGCGKEVPIVPQALRDALKSHGIVIDAMETGAACRTFNILLTEGRAAAAALIAI
tara:strand:+ start:280 stop:648 length:369 start_codon:yes stop_codon:yes gene_type:complete